MEKTALTLRLPSDLYKEAKNIAKKKGKTFSGFLRELLEERLKEEKNKILFEAFSRVADDKEEIDVEYALEAQREVVIKND